MSKQEKIQNIIKEMRDLLRQQEQLLQKKKALLKKFEKFTDAHSANQIRKQISDMK